MPEIIVLPGDVVSKIAAGEVVESPASVVKELVENSLDAGATRIVIEVDGIRNIRVTDNGQGMDRDDVKLAFQRHATSKIKVMDDIFSISTLGFRGEALPSIAAVAKVTCTTRQRGAATGFRVKVKGEVKSLEEVGCPEGTTVEVKDLFYNTPARKKFLKKPAREFARIVEVVENLALCRPDAAFKLVHDWKTVLEAPPAKDLEERLPTILGREDASEMIPVRYGPDDFGILVGGFVSRPEVTRSRKSIRLIVNGRSVVSKDVTRAVVEAYGTKLAKGRQPVAVVVLGVPTSRIDVNVHPAKTEVRFPDEAAVASAVRVAVEETLKASGEIRKVTAEVKPVEELLWSKPAPKAAREIKVQATRQATIDGSRPVEARVARPKGKGHQGLPEEMTIKGQVGSCYILAEIKDHLLIIDQHAAHEKITYEALVKAGKGEGIDSQELLDPVTIELGASEAKKAEALLEELDTFGFKVEMFGPKTILVKSVPTVLGVAILPEIVKDAISDLLVATKKGPAAVEETRDRILKTMACHTSIRAGRDLELTEMQSLVELLYTAEDPYNCPHGRPTIIMLPYKKLEKWFERS